ncbi:MAG: hypothetical protein ACJ789_05560 [Thermomicrobiales bacterium]
MDRLPDSLHPDDKQLWLLIGLCVAMIFTIEAVEEAVDGAWPHQRRASQIAPAARSLQAVWGIIALLVLPGILLTILSLGVMIWQNVVRPDTLVIGGVFLGIGWVIFLLGSIDRLRFRSFLGQVGFAGALALIVILLIGDALLLIAFLDIRPSWETVRDALPLVS